ncbi:MAG: DegV family protein [Clostridia bacterium]|nr:DegV family protein [Clostridia bacterium]
MNFKIVTDSSSDILELNGVDFESAPLKIITAKKEYVDDKNLDVDSMVNELLNYKGKSSTSCPNREDWLDAFGDAENIFCITITGTLSGSYNSAVMAKAAYTEKFPNRNVFVFNTLTAGPEIALIIEKTAELISMGKSFDEIQKEIIEYSENTGLIFMLESMKNLANNGRVSPITAKMAGLLGIRVVGKASERGDLEPISKCRGEGKALEVMAEYIKKSGFKNGKIRIAHCLNENAANVLKELLEKEHPNTDIKIYPSRGLCSYYAEKGGMLVGFERI